MDRNDTSIPYAERCRAGCLRVTCPSCKASIGEPCHTPKGKVKEGFHGTRFDLASACNFIPVI